MLLQIHQSILNYKSVLKKVKIGQLSISFLLCFKNLNYFSWIYLNAFLHSWSQQTIMCFYCTKNLQLMKKADALLSA